MDFTIYFIDQREMNFLVLDTIGYNLSNCQGMRGLTATKIL